MFTKTVKKCAQVTLGAAALSLVVSGAAFADVNTNLGVSATVTNDCTIAATPTVAVGNYDTLAAAVLQTGTLSVACTTGAIATIAMDAGANASHHSAGTTRAMTDGTHYLGYELYSDSGRTVVWGTGANAKIEDAAETSAPVDYIVYATVPASQDVPAGDYADSVSVTVSF